MILFESSPQNKNTIQNHSTCYQKKNKVFIDAGYLFYSNLKFDSNSHLNHNLNVISIMYNTLMSRDWCAQGTFQSIGNGFQNPNINKCVLWKLLPVLEFTKKVEWEIRIEK